MAYVSIESDDRMEEGPEGLQFQSFLDSDNHAANEGGSGGTNTGRGYIPDRGSSGRSGFWTLEAYQHHFDVDTKTVLQRCYMTMFPPAAPSYLSTYLSPSADLYGPFWTLTTLIFSLFVCSSLASAIAAWLSNPDAAASIAYDFGLIFTATALVYAYGIALPVLLWFALRYLGVGEWGITEAVAVWGYGQFVWIPVTVLCVIPVPLVRWVLVGIAFLLSGYFLVANVYPVLASADAKPVRLIIILLVILHAGLALSFKVLFFSYYAVKEIGVPDPIPA
ncbi:Yip1 domain family protein [Laetiporus sulphureus 93-53]|uniref:Yip1 domain family protein n=1 Tax=Laetiporus sulphureus 93-53 TaxID=1314785 RepID=A0A165IEJ8_9APHY|nr:Yip1 domain family protein [Laetiporus sulphureus 93-53]KZT12966.1 Yip1 domain family protein [Laetiporus sulphureus 93-53]